MKKFPGLFLLLYILLSKNAFAQVKKNIDYTQPETYILAGINIVGDNTVDKNMVVSYSGLRTGQKITIPGDEISRAIQNLWKQERFSDVKIYLDSTSAGKAWISIRIKSRPLLGKYTFNGPGMKKSTKKKLSEEIKITTRDVITEQMYSRIIRDVKEFYNKKGFPNAKVNIQSKHDSANISDLVINVDKGSRIKIREIEFVGNKSFSENRLQRLMKKTKERQAINIFRNSKFKSEEYEKDKESLIAFYHKNGFKDVHVISDSTYITADDSSRMNIKIKLFEGNKYYFRNIQWAGNTKYDSRFLSAILGIKKGSVYNPEMLERNLYISQTGLDVTSLYMDDGYLFFSVTPVELLVENDSVDLEIRIFEGPQATINKVTVVGNTKTHDHVILREIRTKPGQKFSRSDIIRSQRELSQLGYFDPEKLGVNPKPNPKDGTVDLEYTVVEKPSDQIELSGGWGAGRIVGVLGLSLNNFSLKNTFHRDKWQGYPSGDGQRVSIRAQTNGPEFQSYNLSFTEPWFGGKKPNSLTFSAFYSVSNYGSTSNKQILKTPGVSVGLGKRLRWPDDYFTSYKAVSYQYYWFENLDFVPNFQTGFSHNLNYRYLISRSSSNHPIYPTGGSNISAQVQLTPPWSLFTNKNYKDATAQEKYKLMEYHKWKFDASYYMALGGAGKKRKLVLGTNMNFGFLGMYNRQLGLAPFERFYVGGDGLTGYNLDGRELIRLRGYKDFSAVTPQITDVNGKKLESGGTIYNRITMELRYPITTSDAATIYGLAFIEGGNAWLRFKDFNPFVMKRSAGLGIRAFLPMFGLLGFDWGYGFDDPVNAIPGAKINPSDRSHFHFLIGQPLSF